MQNHYTLQISSFSKNKIFKLYNGMNIEYKLNAKDEIYFFYEKINYESLALKARIYLFYGDINLLISKVNSD